MVRRESVASPRAYVYEANRNYILSDFWLDDENELLGGFINMDESTKPNTIINFLVISFTFCVQSYEIITRPKSRK